MNPQPSRQRWYQNKKFVISLSMITVAVLAGLLYTPGSARQQQDIAELTAILNQAYETNSNSAITAFKVLPAAKPKQLTICSITCPQHPYVANLVYYKNTAVTVHAYAAGLSVPNANTVYIVDNANCNADKNGLGKYGVTANGNPAGSVLYASTEQDGKAVQRCVDIF